MYTPNNTHAFFSTTDLVNSGSLRSLRLIFDDPKLRPPVLHEMQPDIDRLAASIARTRADQTCYALDQRDLIAEQNLKLATLITKGRLDSIPTRAEAFRFIKTVFNNHVKSLVSKHRLTLKRGAKKDETGTDTEVSLDHPAAFVSTKNADLSADDPDQHVQISDPTSGWGTEDSFIEEISVYLNPMELAVLRNYSEPCARTRFYAEVDAMVGRKSSGNASVVNFSAKNHADGLGMELGHFKRVLRSLQEKINWLRQMKDSDVKEIAWNRAIARLEEAFDIQIPQSIEKPIIRRLLTVAALDQYDVVENNDAIKQDLELVGAKVPERRAGVLACFGVLFQRNNRTCAACGLNRACAEEAANYGLGSVTLHDQLLGAKQCRVPVVVANSAEPAPLLSARDEEIYNYLRTNFNAQYGIGEYSFRHRDTGGVAVIMQLQPTVEIRVPRPAATVQSRLVKRGNSWTVPGELEASEVIGLIDQHSHDTFITSK